MTHSEDTEAMKGKRVKFAKEEHSRLSHSTQIEDDHKVNQNLDLSMRTKNTMMKDAIDGEASEERAKDQIARSAKTKSLLSCGQGTDNQQQGKLEVDKWLESKESKESNGYERKSTFKVSKEKQRSNGKA